MKYYFAHPISIYNTRKEGVLIDMIHKTTFLSNPLVLNPNSEYHECQYKLKGMDYFLSLVDECDALIIYPFEDNTIGAGIAKEALRAFENKKRVYQIDAQTFEIQEIFELKNCFDWKNMLLDRFLVGSSSDSAMYTPFNERSYFCIWFCKFKRCIFND